MAHLAVMQQATEHLGAGSIGGRLLVVLLLVTINAFFVAAEFALVAVRRTRIDEMVLSGDRKARIVQSALDHLDRYIAGTQLGITLASLGLGWVGEPAVASILDRILEIFGMPMPPPGVHTAASLGIGFLILTFLHIVLGELAPKSVALVRP
ncbi:MAG: CNNM domain-containing protein, partial [Gemmatimonadales bacterium]